MDTTLIHAVLYLAIAAVVLGVINLICLANMASDAGQAQRTGYNISDRLSTLQGDVSRMSGEVHVLQTVYSDLTASPVAKKQV